MFDNQINEYIGHLYKLEKYQSDSLEYKERYIYDGWNLLATYRNGVQTKFYIWGEDVSGTMAGAGGVGGLLAEENSNGLFVPTYDGNGNITAYVDHDGNTVASYTYDPFGNTLEQSGPLADKFTFKFSTKPELPFGLYNYTFRFYNPNTATWLTRDPIGENGGVNLHGFVVNNPVNNIDILGNWWSNVHNVATVRWAKLLQYTDEAASEIGNVNEAVDGGALGLSSISWAPWGTQGYHFNRNQGGEDSRLAYAKHHLSNAEFYCTKTYSAKDHEKAAKELGTALHPLQDWVAHADHEYYTTGAITTPHNSCSNQAAFGTWDYPDMVELDVQGSPDGRASRGYLKVIMHDGRLRDYAIYTRGSMKRLRLTKTKTEEALNNFKKFLKGSKASDECKCYFLGKK